MDREKPDLKEYLETVAFLFRKFLDAEMTMAEWLENPLTEWMPVSVDGYEADAKLVSGVGRRPPMVMARFDGSVAYIHLAKRRLQETVFCQWERNFHWDGRDFSWLNCRVGEIVSSMRGFELL